MGVLGFSFLWREMSGCEGAEGARETATGSNRSFDNPRDFAYMLFMLHNISHQTNDNVKDNPSSLLWDLKKELAMTKNHPEKKKRSPGIILTDGVHQDNNRHCVCSERGKNSQFFLNTNFHFYSTDIIPVTRREATVTQTLAVSANTC